MSEYDDQFLTPGELEAEKIVRRGEEDRDRAAKDELLELITQEHEEWEADRLLAHDREREREREGQLG
jgi:hypothetical protein